jgi:hypothetical protein
MALGENIDALSKELKEYVRKSADGCKLRLIDNLSHLAGGLMCGCILCVLLSGILLILLFALVLFATPAIGLFPALFLAVVLLAIVAIIVYLCRASLFTDRVVRVLVRLFFEEDDENG